MGDTVGCTFPLSAEGWFSNNEPARKVNAIMIAQRAISGFFTSPFIDRKSFYRYCFARIDDCLG